MDYSFLSDTMNDYNSLLRSDQTVEKIEWESIREDDGLIISPMGSQSYKETAASFIMNNPSNKNNTATHSRINKTLLDESVTELDALVGLDAAKFEIKKLIAMIGFSSLRAEMGMMPSGNILTSGKNGVAPPNAPFYHMVYTGNPGTGKTTFARTVAKIFYALGILNTDRVVSVLPADMVANIVGGTQDRTTEICKSALDGVLFIDEAHNLGQQDSSGRTDAFDQKAIQTLIPLMTDWRHRMVVILAGYTQPMENLFKVDQGLKSRVPVHVPFEDFTSEQMQKILKNMAAQEKLKITSEALAAAIKVLEEKKKSAGSLFGNARDVANLFSQMKMALAFRVMGMKGSGDLDKIPLDAKKFVVETITIRDISVPFDKSKDVQRSYKIK